MNNYTVIKVHYEVYLNNKQFERLRKKSEELGFSFGDAGPKLSIRRLLMGEGMDNCFNNENSLDLRFADEIIPN